MNDLNDKNDNKDKNDEGIARAADWLLKGAVMLRKACPQCESPLYRLMDNKVYCASCKSQVIIIGPDDPIPPEFLTQPPSQDEMIQTRSTPEISRAEKVLTNKLHTLTEALEATDDVDEIIKLTEVIDKLTGTIKKLQK
ncbi:MAG: hypothetical protein KAR35_05325 [Candidatus Heimdallarchaeota archaeon]|nr:hypothetical protein [Candidatus Heimdallarchaeota archaeon]MCK5048778.1 hypothetical protein [Candidatus Heimdallarchaeota archaeon]